MSEIPGDLKFLQTHEWVRINNDEGTAVIGISDHAQSLLGDLVFIELPSVGDRAEIGSAIAVVESVKAASDIYSPVSGTVIKVNEVLSEKPETVNEDTYGDGWLFVVEVDNLAACDELLGSVAYAQMLEDDEH